MRILVAVDGSDASDAALDHACELVDATDGSLTIVHAVNPDVYAGSGADSGEDLVRNVEAAEEEGAALLESAAATAADRGVPLDRTELLRGEPVETIARFTETADPPFDGLVVGHRGLSDRYERMLGSVAKGLVGRAAAPVTVVPREGHVRSGRGR